MKALNTQPSLCLTHVWNFWRVPFGLCNSPAVFQLHIRAIFKKLLDETKILSYLDDIMIPTKTEEENMAVLKEVLTVASEYDVKINRNKCKFLMRKVEFLGYIIEGGTIKTSETKTNAVKFFPKPKSCKEIQSFIGLTSYFRKLILNYAVIARPLTQMLKNGVKFQFGQEQFRAFQDLKNALTQDPVLKLFCVGAETKLHTDASQIGLGAILLQKNDVDGLLHPIFYASWKTTPQKEKLTSYELEILTVVKALKKFGVYLLPTQLKIDTDCRAFVQTMSKKETCLQVARWAIRIGEFKYNIEHRPENSMRYVDALSRNPPSICVVQEIKDGLIDQVKT